MAFDYNGEEIAHRLIAEQDRARAARHELIEEPQPDDDEEAHRGS
jgi:hypothetical protein